MVALPEPFHVISPLAEVADAYVAAGYDIIPVLPNKKAPGQYTNDNWKLYDEWPSYAARQRATPSIIHAWKGWPDANIGIILGTVVGGYQVIAVDVDTTDPDEQEMIMSQLPPSRMRKQAERGFTVFYRASLETRTKRYSVPAPTMDKPNAQRTLCELLTGNAPKQTVMPPSIHPCGLEYTWYGKVGLVPAAELPVLTDDHVEQLEDTLRHMGWDDHVLMMSMTPGKERTPQEPGEEPNYWREINNAALANLDRWCGELGLPKLRRVSSVRWEAVATWRTSSTGQATIDRKANLSIHAAGIKDMGTQETYSAADVVMRAFSWPDDKAFEWLRGKLGMKDEFGFFDDITVSTPRQFAEADDGSLYDQSTGEVVSSARKAAIEHVEIVEGLTKPEHLPDHNNDNDPTADDFEELPDRLTHPEGLLGDVTQWIVDTARQPNRVLALGSAIVTVGTIAGRRDAGPTMAGTALYVLNLAPTGGGKQHGLDQMQRLLIAAGAQKLIGSGEFMSMTAAVRDLEHQPLSATPLDEFGSLLKRINSKRGGVHDQGISKVLRQAWGMPFGAYRTPSWANSSSKTIYSPAMSILGCSTPQEFYNSLTDGDRENGTLNRILVLATNTKMKKIKPIKDAFTVPEDLAAQLETLYEASDRASQENDAPIEAQSVPWGEGAEAIYVAFDEKVDGIRDGDGETADYYARTSEIAVRLATVSAVGRDLEFPEVSIADMEWGRDIALWASKKLARDASKYASDTAAGALWAKVTEKLTRAGGYLNYEELAAKMKLNAKDMKDTLGGMEGAGLIEEASVERSDGRPGRKRRVVRLLSLR